MKNLIEGMRKGDLEDLVLPLISVNEYESKIDEDAIVFAIYVADQDAANDLNRFIQKTPVAIIDTDISPAPDTKGYYLVFFELLNNKKLSENALSIIDEISPLVGVDKWRAQLGGEQKLKNFNQEALEKYFDKNNKVTESIKNFLTDSNLTSVSIHQDNIRLRGIGYQAECKIMGFGNSEKVLSGLRLNEAREDLSFHASALTRRIGAMLGESWQTALFGSIMTLRQIETPNVVLAIKI